MQRAQALVKRQVEGERKTRQADQMSDSDIRLKRYRLASDTVKK